VGALTPERVRYWQKIAIIESTEGFKLLSRVQQRMIALSLYIQDRSQRGIIGYTGQLSFHDVYRASSQHIAKAYCHGAVRNLEEGLPIRDDYTQVYFPAGFFDTKYFPISGKEEAVRLIESQGFPCLVFVNSLASNGGIEYQIHSFLALGHDKSGEVVIWEKWGYGKSYLVSSIDSKIIRYGRDRYWGVRPLKK